MNGLRQTLFECVQVRLAIVHLLAGSGVNDNFLQGISVEYRHQLKNIIDCPAAQSGLDGKPVGDGGNGFFQKGVYFSRVGQQSGTALFFGHHGKGASQIPVYRRIAQIIKSHGKVYKIIGLIADYLGHDGHG